MSEARLYHEKQVAALCGVHCVNTLLQGPYFTEVELAQIAQELDALERQFMQEGGITSEDYLKFMSEESGNVAADGMFSIQVLSKALGVWNLEVVPLDNPEMRSAALEPQNQTAFICNLQEHWFTIRRMPDGEWWNFNSLFPAPQPLSQFYLAAFLSSLKDQGYTIFVVTGQLPLQQQRPSNEQGSGGRWFTSDEAKTANDEAAVARQRGKAMNAVENAFSLAAAQGGTLQLRPKRQAPQDNTDAWQHGGFADDDDADLAAAIAASLGQEAGPSSSARVAAPPPSPGLRHVRSSSSVDATMAGSPDRDAELAADFMDDDDDPELAAAIAASMAEAYGTADVSGGAGSSGAAGAGSSQQVTAAPEVLDAEPEAGPGVVELAFRLPNGQRASRRFAVTEPCSAVHLYLRVAHSLNTGSHTVATQFPRKELLECSNSLQETGFGERQMLNVELKR